VRPGRGARTALLAMGLAWGGAAQADDRPTLDGGDRSWASGDRPEARAQWRAAAAGPDPAVRAQAEARLLLVSGNLGLAVHGPRAEAALSVCPPADPWCAIAEADLVLFGRTIGVPLPLEDAVRAAVRAEPRLPGPAAARLVWAGAVGPEALDGVEHDALGEVILAAGGRFPAGPGTWVLGVGALGASGLGVGGGLRFVHPDAGLTGWRVEAAALLTSRLAGQASLRIVSPGTWGASVQAQGARLVADRYAADGTVAQQLVTTASLRALPGLRTPHVSVGLGPVARWDAVGEQRFAGHGGALRARWTASPGEDGAQVDGGVEAAFADYAHQEADASLRIQALDARLAGWLHGAAAPWSDAPYWRLPSAGGGQVLRHGAIGRFRDAALAAAVVEWRLRPQALLGGALFLEGARIDGWHGGLGAGLRLRLPPRPHNTVRLDVAWGDGGLGVSAGWGEAF
jgi:hypothetical protein